MFNASSRTGIRTFWTRASAEFGAGVIVGRRVAARFLSGTQVALKNPGESEVHCCALGWGSIDALLAEVTVVDDEIVPQGAM